MANPKAALAAINSIGETVGRITLSEVTLSKAAILEAIGSPLFNAGKPDDMTLDKVLPTLYVLATPAIECKRLLADSAFDAAVCAWGDTVPLNDAGKIIAAMKRIMKRIGDVAPQGMVDNGDGTGEKKTATGG